MKHEAEHPFVNEYRTGGTDLPRHNPLLAAGIALLAILTGILLTSAFLLLRAQSIDSQKSIVTLSLPETPISPDNAKPEDAPYMDGEVVSCQELGLHCQAISEFCERLYSLPSGIYIVSVAQKTPAARLGLLPGDILISINGEPLQTPGALLQFLSVCPDNSRVALEFCRKGKNYTVYFTPGD